MRFLGGKDWINIGLVYVFVLFVVVPIVINAGQ